MVKPETVAILRVFHEDVLTAYLSNLYPNVYVDNERSIWLKAEVGFAPIRIGYVQNHTEPGGDRFQFIFNATGMAKLGISITWPT